jgi:hypothetical protein
MAMRPRMRLRSALAVMTCIALGFGICAVRERQLSAAMAQIESLGGRAYLSAHCDDDGAPVGLMQESRGILGNLVAIWQSRISPFRSISAVSFGGCHIRASHLRVLDACPALVWLDISDTWVGDDGIEKLASLKQLKVLGVADSRLSQQGIDQLGRRHPKLTIVDWSVKFKETLDLISTPTDVLPRE